MKKLQTILSSLIALGMLYGCSTQATLPVLIDDQTTSLSQPTMDSQYVVTAYAIIDKMPKTISLVEQEKLIKDFEINIKPLNRYALEKILSYTAKVLQDNVKPGEDPKQTSTIKLIYSTLHRFLDLQENFSHRLSDSVTIALEKDPVKQDTLIKTFEKNAKSLAKMDAKALISAIKGEDSNLGNIFPVNAPFTQRLIKILEDKIAS